MATIDQALDVLRPALRDRHERLLRRCAGRVLHLGGAGETLRHAVGASEIVVLGEEPVPVADVPVRSADAALDDDAALRALGCFDVIVCVLRLPLVDDEVGTLKRLTELLTDTGCLWFLEPSRGTGTRSRAARLVGPLVRPQDAADEDRFDRDISGALRAAGLLVTDIDRFELRGVPWQLASVVEGAARRPTPRRPRLDD